MEIKVLIIDDEQPARDIVKHYLSFRNDVLIVGEADNGFDAFKLINEVNPDLIFLDVQMPKLTGFELLDILESPPMVIFTTAFDQFAIKAFEVSAIDYLLKPFSQDRIISALEKAIELLNSKNNMLVNNYSQLTEASDEEINRIVVKKGKTVKIIKPDDILYITAEDDYVMIYTLDDRYLKHRTMKYLELNLPSNFLRIHRSNIINTHHILEVQPYKKDSLTVKMINNECVNASQSGSVRLRKYLR